jgi:hypothetical protein
MSLTPALEMNQTRQLCLMSEVPDKSSPPEAAPTRRKCVWFFERNLSIYSPRQCCQWSGAAAKFACTTSQQMLI